MFVDLFEDVKRPPPKKVIEHEIQIIDNTPLLNLGLYGNSMVENEKIKN